MEENWVSLTDFGFPDYSVSDLGQIYNDAIRRMMTQSKNNTGFMKVSLMDEDNVRRTVEVSRLVAKAFVPGRTEIFNTPIHLDGNKEHTWASNLAWRPRWFAIAYHAQFKNEQYWIDNPIIEITENEKFENSRQAVVKYGLLAKDILMATTNHNQVFPTWQEFRIL